MPNRIFYFFFTQWALCYSQHSIGQPYIIANHKCMHYTQVYIIHELFIPFVYCFMNNNKMRSDVTKVYIPVTVPDNRGRLGPQLVLVAPIHLRLSPLQYLLPPFHLCYHYLLSPLQYLLSPFHVSYYYHLS